MTTPKNLRADNTPPRTGILALCILGAIIGFLCLKLVFGSYFDAVYSAELNAKVATQPAVELNAIREREGALLNERGVPIPSVITQLGRGRQAAPAIVAPQPSTDRGAITGWNSLPAFVHTAEPAPAAPPAPTPNP